jgi:hypothetical protein
MKHFQSSIIAANRSMMTTILKEKPGFRQVSSAPVTRETKATGSCGRPSQRGEPAAQGDPSQYLAAFRQLLFASVLLVPKGDDLREASA